MKTKSLRFKNGINGKLARIVYWKLFEILQLLPDDVVETRPRRRKRKARK